MANNKSINVRVNDDCFNAIKNVANLRGVSMSDVVREVLNSQPSATINIGEMNFNFNNNYYSSSDNEKKIINEVPFNEV